MGDISRKWKCFAQWRDRLDTTHQTSAVCLHGHSEYSREGLSFIPRLAQAVPGLPALIRAQEKRFLERHGAPLDFERGFWTPPLSPAAAVALERRSIEAGLGLRCFVSLTDHDTVHGCIALRVLPAESIVPISLEWTVPWRGTFLHLGVHNLPPRSARAISSELLRWAENPREACLSDLLAFLHSHKDVLLVVNHPLWDECGVGAQRHRVLTEAFIAKHRQWLHALELNGLRSTAENRQVTALAEACSLPPVSGGDRHTIEPAAILNLTSAASFAEFVDEVRCGYSDVLFTDLYRQPLRLRLLHNIVDVMRDYPDLPPERRHWTGRVFYALPGREPAPLSSMWERGGPPVVQFFASLTLFLAHQRVRDAFRLPAEALRRRRPEIA